jgi:hypothetical protein
LAVFSPSKILGTTGGMVWVEPVATSKLLGYLHKENSILKACWPDMPYIVGTLGRTLSWWRGPSSQSLLWHTCICTYMYTYSKGRATFRCLANQLNVHDIMMYMYMYM